MDVLTLELHYLAEENLVKNSRCISEVSRCMVLGVPQKRIHMPQSQAITLLNTQTIMPLYHY